MKSGSNRVSPSRQPVGYTGSGSDTSGADGEAPATSSSSPFMAAIEHTTMDIVMKSIVTVAVIIGLIVN